ncbi:MAG: hypothetical protein ACERKN_13380 [Velocimicrobium sp.]
MTIAGVRTSYAYPSSSYQKTRAKESTDFCGNISLACEETEEKNDSKLLGLTMIPEEGSNIIYGMRAQYAAESTEDNPIIQVTSNYGGKTVSYHIAINEVDPKNASQLEMFALCSYADDKGISDGGTFGSYQKLNVYSQNAQMNGYCSGLGGTDSFINSKFNWKDIMTQMMDDYLEGGIYNQYRDCKKLLALFDRFGTKKDSGSVQKAGLDSNGIGRDTANKSANGGKLSTEEMMQKIQERINEIYTKLQNGDTEPTYQIGGQTYTEKEWNKLLEKFDTVQEAIKAAMNEENQKQTKVNVSGLTDEDEVEKIDESALQSIVSESTTCSYPIENGTEGKNWYVTVYTQDGIFCRKCGSSGEVDNNLWAIEFTDSSQYNKVIEFLNKFDKDTNLTFASHENFWQDLLAGKIDEENVKDAEYNDPLDS